MSTKSEETNPDPLSQSGHGQSDGAVITPELVLRASNIWWSAWSTHLTRSWNARIACRKPCCGSGKRREIDPGNLYAFILPRAAFLCRNT